MSGVVFRSIVALKALPNIGDMFTDLKSLCGSTNILLSTQTLNKVNNKVFAARYKIFDSISSHCDKKGESFVACTVGASTY